MTPTPRMRRALHQVEARRIELERAIITDLEERFFAVPEPEVRNAVIHLGLAAIDRSAGTCTGNASQFSTAWFV
jgi:hypothetical protein